MHHLVCEIRRLGCGRHFAAFGFACGGGALGHSVGAESCPRHLTATALGLVSTIAYVIAGGLQILPGIVLDMTTASHSPAGVVCHYTIGQYCDSFVVFPIASICALIAALGISESFPGHSVPPLDERK